MSGSSSRTRINVDAFMEDYVRGMPESELQAKYSLDHSQLSRVVLTLKKRGKLGVREVDKRQENLRIRFGEDPKPSDGGFEQRVSVDLDTGLVLHCPSCGASVSRDAKNCGYCGSHLDFSLKGKTIHCPHCYQKNPADGRFCVICAKPLKIVSEGRSREDRICPRCNAGMVERSVGDFPAIGCKQCDGLFIPHDTFESMQETHERVIEETTSRMRRESAFETTVRYVRCPVCKNMMNRQNFAQISGVILDVCRDHGIWFDAGELAKIMDFIAKGGVVKARSLAVKKQKEEKVLEKLRRERMAYDGGVDLFSMDPRSSYHDEVTVLDFVGDLFKLFGK